MKKEKKSAIRYFSQTAKDLYTIMPMEVSAIILLKLLKASAAFLQITVTAHFFDTAGSWLEGIAKKEELLG